LAASPTLTTVNVSYNRELTLLASPWRQLDGLTMIVRADGLFFACMQTFLVDSISVNYHAGTYAYDPSNRTIPPTDSLLPLPLPPKSWAWVGQLEHTPCCLLAAGHQRHRGDSGT